MPDESNWRDDAVCRDAPEDFTTPSESAQKALAYAFCGGCPVRVECGEHALAIPEWYGVWGGMTEYERRTLVRRQKRAAKKSNEVLDNERASA